MARLTVYLTDDMRHQINRHPNVNWSAIAQDAFEVMLLRLDRDWLFCTNPEQVKKMFAAEDKHHAP